MPEQIIRKQNIYHSLFYFPIAFFILFFYLKISFFSLYINKLYIFTYLSIFSAFILFLIILLLLYGLYQCRGYAIKNFILIVFLIALFIIKLLEFSLLTEQSQIVLFSNHSFFILIFILSIRAFQIYRHTNKLYSHYSPFAILLMYTVPFIICYVHATLISGIAAEWFELRQMPVEYYLFDSDVKLSQMICCIGLLIFGVQLIFDKDPCFRNLLSNENSFLYCISFVFLLIFLSIFSHQLYAYNQRSIGRFLAASNIRNYAINAFQKSINAKPFDDETHKMMGTTLVSQGQFEKALAHFLKAIALNPVDPQTYINAGLVSIKQNNLFAAIHYFSEAVWLDPRNANAHHYLGFVFSVQEKIDMAIIQFRESLRLNPDDENAHFHIALLFSKQKKWKQALGHFQEALWINPNFIEAYIHLGNLFINVGAVENAFETFKKALHLKPNDPTIIQQLNTITQMSFDFAQKLIDQHKFDQAIIVYQRILKYRPDYSVSIHYNISCAYAKNNQPKEAVEWLKKSVQMGFKDWKYLQNDPDFDAIRNHALFVDFIQSNTGS